MKNVEETFTASCSFGSIHQKEFRFLTCNMLPHSICRPCTRDHSHVKIEGQYTKGSAVLLPRFWQRRWQSSLPSTYELWMATCGSIVWIFQGLRASLSMRS